MTADAVHLVLKRDRALVLASLVALTALAWGYLIWMARAMDMDTDTSAPGAATTMTANDGMSDTAGMGDAMTSMTSLPEWTPSYFVAMVLMWAIMMVGMMLPSAAPTILLYAAMHRKSGRVPYLSTTGFVAGYLAVWALFSVVATFAQWALDQAALLSPMMVSTSPYLGAGLLAAAGVYQMTPWKDACLTHCRGPIAFLEHHWRTGRGGAFIMGLEHGAFCLGCCFVLMLLLFVGGVMNLVWIAVIAGFVLIEKLLPPGKLAERITGSLMILAAAGFMLKGLSG